MQITPNEIASIEEAGMLDNEPVKMVRTKGGFFIATGKPRGKGREEALAAGSHPAIVKYNLAKQFPQFQAALMKSENAASPAVVESHSKFLSEDLKKSGHDIYSVQNNTSIDFQITKHNMKVATVRGSIENNKLMIESPSISKDFNHAIAGATAEKALSCGIQKVEFKSK